MVIRPEQRVAMQEALERDFVVRLMQHLRQHHADAVTGLDDNRLKERVEYGITQARSYGLAWQSSIASFVGLMFEFGPGFNQHPAAQAVLRDASIPAEFRVRELTERLPEQTWEEIGSQRRTAWPDEGDQAS